MFKIYERKLSCHSIHFFLDYNCFIFISTVFFFFLNKSIEFYDKTDLYFFLQFC